MGENQEMARVYWENYAEAFTHPLKAGGMLSKFVTNTAVTGDYAEAWLESLVASMLPQFRISTGAVIRPLDRSRNLRKIPQCDIIIWDPSKLPALFEQGNFALVPTHSVRAIIEVKRTCDKIEKFEEQLRKLQNCMPPDLRPQVLGVVLSHDTRLFTGEIKPDWLTVDEEKWQETPAMTRLLKDWEQTDADDIFVLIYFLAQVAGHYSLVG